MKLYDLIHDTSWKKEKLIKLYPSLTESQSKLNRFESTYNDILKLTSAECAEYIYFARRDRDVS